LDNRFNAKINVLFLNVILVAGTFAAITPSSFIIGVEAQSETEYGYNSYGPTPEYQGNNNYNKLKDSVIIEKIKCINININFLGNTGDINLGNTGEVTPTSVAAKEEADLTAYSSADGYGNERYYDDRYNNKKDIGFVCVINNNNNNTNVVSGGDSATLTCEECFRAFLTETQISAFLPLGGSTTLEGFCNSVESGGFSIDESVFRSNLATVGVSTGNIDALIACLKNLGIQFNP
jgi:hypothetical protein